MLSIQDPEKLYHNGVKFYETLQYDEAIIIFKALVVQYPTEKKYWFSFGCALQAKKEYALALKAWAMTSILSENDPYPHYYAAECYFYLNDKIQQEKALIEATKIIQDQDHPLIEKIHILNKMEVSDV